VNDLGSAELGRGEPEGGDFANLSRKEKKVDPWRRKKDQRRIRMRNQRSPLDASRLRFFELTTKRS